MAARILMAEDNRADVTLVREALKVHQLACELQVVEDGELALRFFEALDADANLSCPDLLLLDLNLPKVNGEEVLSHLRVSRRCAQMPVIVITSSDSDKDRDMAHRMGAARYFRKPSDLAEFMRLGAVIKGLLEKAIPG
jgi:Response regulators consisting of a CheY-like receiver domain and a winged-helix DNA-binding domain